jgi:hypothetical protein
MRFIDRSLTILATLTFTAALSACDEPYIEDDADDADDVEERGYTKPIVTQPPEPGNICPDVIGGMCMWTCTKVEHGVEVGTAMFWHYKQKSDAQGKCVNAGDWPSCVMHAGLYAEPPSSGGLIKNNCEGGGDDSGDSLTPL